VIFVPAKKGCFAAKKGCFATNKQNKNSCLFFKLLPKFVAKKKI
jgi:hypothetical protein